MRPRILLVVAGIPSKIDREVARELNRKMEHVDVVTCHPLNPRDGYSEEYVAAVYLKFVKSLWKRDRAEKSDVLRASNVLVLYLDKSDNTDDELVKKFCTEALVLPVTGIDIAVTSLNTKNERNSIVNNLVERGKRTIERAHDWLSVIAEEVTNRDNRTCLLLPPKNFGKGMSSVYRCVQEAVANGMDREEFRTRIKAVTNSLPKKKVGRKQFFVGAKGLVFECPTKAGPRHGQVPDWGIGDHDYSCVVRGRVRFGISYDPRFHYDCDLSKRVGKRFPSCHGEKTVGSGRNHVNIAPNDNVR